MLNLNKNDFCKSLWTGFCCITALVAEISLYLLNLNKINVLLYLIIACSVSLYLLG